jgi:hypothetical protein
LFALLLCNKYHYISFDDVGPTLQIDTATSTITAVRNTAYIEHSASVIQLESNQHGPSITQIFWPVCLVSASMRVVHVAYMFVPITFQLLGRFQRPLMLCFAAAASRAVCGACADDARELMIKLLFALTNLSPTLAKVRQHLSLRLDLVLLFMCELIYGAGVCDGPMREMDEGLSSSSSADTINIIYLTICTTSTATSTAAGSPSLLLDMSSASNALLPLLQPPPQVVSHQHCLHPMYLCTTTSCVHRSYFPKLCICGRN